MASTTADADPAMTLQSTFTEAVPRERTARTETMTLGTREDVGTLIETHEVMASDGIGEVTSTLR